MTWDAFLQAAMTFFEREPGNLVSPDLAIQPSVAGMQLYDAPIAKVGAANDPLFEQLKSPEAIGPHFLTPEDWLPGAQRVISLFFPISAAVRNENGVDMDLPSPGWLHARIEGQAMIGRLGTSLCELLARNGFRAVAPVQDERFKAREGKPWTDGGPPVYTSNWSERHVAFVCGHGTFGLSKGLITERGVAGRLISIVTDAPFPADRRGYTGLYEYCSMCGACVRNCPMDAIHLETGKEHPPCREMLDRTKVTFAPRYGCGKCQVRVPCETRPATRTR